jgi:cyclopropane fatty-acyl-phospholipid synthase-like methyltransferase
LTDNTTSREEHIVGEEFYNTIYEKTWEQFNDLNSPFQRYRTAKVLEIYTPTADEHVVDLGCGWGTMSFAYAPHCKHVTGVDFSAGSIATCNRLLDKHGFDNVTFIKARAEATGLRSETYDVVVSADLLEHLYPDQTEGFFDECRRLLRPGGRVVLWTPHPGHYFERLKQNNIILKEDKGHVDYKTMPMLLNALTARSFRIERSYYVESHFPILRTIEKLLLPVWPLMRRRIAILAAKAD